MKKRILIFCEGVTDQIFIADCLEIFLKATSSRIDRVVKTKNGGEEPKKEIKFECGEHIEGEIIDVGGCSKLSGQGFQFSETEDNTLTTPTNGRAKQSFHLSNMEDNTELDGVNIVVFDADYTGKRNGNRGFSTCDTKLKNIKETRQVVFDHYIWPNDKDDGEIENLLRQLIPIHKEPIMNCIESHQTCLQNLEIENLRLTELKDKIGYYLHTSMKESAARFRNYKDTDFWDLGVKENRDLEKFKTFLSRFFVV
jgi:hypothetical protein